MRQNKILALLPLALCVATMSAQTKRKVVKPQTKAKTVTVVDKEKEEMIGQMTEATQKIMFIDSIVVDKATFLNSYVLNPETGKVGLYDELFGTKGQAGAYAYVNELGDKCYFSKTDTLGHAKLYTSDLIDGEWSAPQTLKGIDDNKGIESPNYPFMMSDGTTFYFAAKGKESIGGYDIFVTRYDSENGRFLKPENIGMPFNSTANDYMYVVDDYGNIGWFATDRGQKEGKVCIYMFVPSQTRTTYESDNLTDEQLEGFARLSSIAATWGKGTERQEALERIRQIPQRQKQKAAGKKLGFVINDNTVYEQLSDFKVASNKEKFKKLQELKQKLANLGSALDKARDYYATASESERKLLTDEILKSERQYESLELSVKQLEKDIRNSENMALQ